MWYNREPLTAASLDLFVGQHPTCLILAHLFTGRFGPFSDDRPPARYLQRLRLYIMATFCRLMGTCLLTRSPRACRSFSDHEQRLWEKGYMYGGPNGGKVALLTEHQNHRGRAYKRYTPPQASSI